MNNKEILQVAEAVSNEKGVSPEIIFEAIEIALATATKKRYDEDSEIRVVIDRESGDYTTFRRWKVVGDDELALLGTEFTTEEAVEKNPALQVGDVHEEQVENVEFGRIAAQTAKQVIVQKVREAERAQIVDQYRDRVSSCWPAASKVTRDASSSTSATMPRRFARDQLVGRETFRVGDASARCSKSSPGAGRSSS
jgi:N utilization substance protein A